jgi:hypothetical protein
MISRIFLSCSLVALLTACAPWTASPNPTGTRTPAPSATVTASPVPEDTPTGVPPTQTVSPTIEPSPTVEVIPTLEPTLAESLTPLPTLYLPTTVATTIPQPDVGSGMIQFYSPGPLSKLVSPVMVYGYAIPGYNHRGYAYLYGEDGRQISSQVLQLYTAFQWALFTWTLTFEIPGAGELARLSLNTVDQYGRINALYSVHLVLLAEGYTVLNPPGNLKERAVIDKPVVNRRLAGGILPVEGKIRPYNDLPLVIELIDRNGKTIGSALAPVTPASDDSYVPFHTEVPYTVTSGTWALLVVRELDERISGTMYLFSREFYLRP